MSGSGQAPTPVDVDAVIVAHNAGELLVDSVTSAAEQVGAEHVFVMDAESTDGSVTRLHAAGLGVTVTEVPNAGFSASNNRGIELGRARYVLLLNPDAVAQPGAVDALVRCADAHPRAGIVGARILNPDGSAQANAFGRFPTLASTLSLRLWRAWQRLRGNRTLSPRIPDAATLVDWVTGAAMLVRRDAIAEVGPMDEGFFLYLEDVEWCHRMRDSGWDVLLEPSATVVHHLGQAGAESAVVVRAYRESTYRYCDLYGLWGLKAATRVGVAVRSAFGGRA